MTRPAGPADIARAVALALVAALCAVFVHWHVQRLSPHAALLASALGLAPWLVAVPGLWRGARAAYVGSLLLTTPYLAYGLMEVLANPGARRHAAATVFVAFGLALALVAWLRFSRPAAAAPSG